MADPIFGWFAQQNRETLSALIIEHEIQSVLEIGAFLGLSTAWFAERVETVTVIDKFIEVENEPSDNNLVWTLQHHGLPNPFRSIFERNMDDAGVSRKITRRRGLVARGRAARGRVRSDLHRRGSLV